MKAVIYINGLIGKNDEIDGYTLEKFTQELNNLAMQSQDGIDELIVCINSIGGIALEAWKIYSALKILQNEYGVIVKTIAVKDCMSAATIIFLAATIENRFVCTSVEFMIHEVWSSDGGTARELRQKADAVEVSTNELVGLYTTESNLDEKTIKEMLAAETTLNANECVLYGFANDIVDTETGKELLADQLAQDISQMFQDKTSFALSMFNATIEESEIVQNALKKSLGYYRREMPQIDKDVLDLFLSSVRATFGVDSISEEKRTIESLKPAQREINTLKVYEKIGLNAWKSRVYLVSRDGFLIDGHHDWAAGLMRYPSQLVNCLVINVKARELIDFANKLKITYKSSLNMALKKDEQLSFIDKVLKKVGFGGKSNTLVALQRTLLDGTATLEIKSAGETIADGDAVTYADGSEVKDGIYKLSDGEEIYVKDGKITMQEPAEQEDELSKLGLSVALNEEDKKKIMSYLNKGKEELAKKDEELQALALASKKKDDELAKLADKAYKLAELVESKELETKPATQFNQGKPTSSKVSGVDFAKIREDLKNTDVKS